MKSNEDILLMPGTVICIGTLAKLFDSGGPREPCPDLSMGRGNFEGRKGHPIVKYRDTLRSSVQKRLNRSRCRLGCDLGWIVRIVLDGGGEVMRDIAMATTFWLSMDYDFCCVIASNTQFDSRGGFLGSSYPTKI